MARDHTTPKDIHLLAQEAASAEAEGDFARARALSASVCGQADGARASGRSKARETALAIEASDDRLRRLCTDPAAWQVGVGALLAYICAWGYALSANR